MNHPLPHTFTVSPLTLPCATVYSTSRRLLARRVCDCRCWTPGQLVSRDLCRFLFATWRETLQVLRALSVRTNDNPASWSSADTVSQYNEETTNFSLIVTVIHTSFKDVFNYRGYYYFLWLCSPARAMASSSIRFLDHTRHATVGRTPLDKWSARRRDLYLTTHITHNRQISMSPVGSEPTIAAGERP
jgi:hypothetical protein